MRTLIAIEAAVGMLAAAAFVVRYVRVPGWSGTQAGRHIMSVTALLGILLGMILVGRVVGGLPMAVWALGLGVLDVMLIGRVWLLARIQSAPREENSDEDR